MVGKHIFVRCRNEQNNAGTWTAAMTQNIVDKDIVRNYIEPRCNMDETFAQNALMSNASNNVLRIYYVNGATLVVTRTYWVTDRITETQGRKGAYSVSYILTGNDIASFCNDYTGAFDEKCFEDYDSLVARTAENATGRITIGEEQNIFSHGQMQVDSSVLGKCGFNKQLFVQFMNGLYDAVENKKHLAVILPKNVREAWEQNGDNTAEKLGYYVLSLLPDFMRINVGMASHWSCKISDKMVSDMPLIFVHPSSDEDIADLRRDGAHIVDLDTGKFATEIPNIAPSYFSYVYDNIDNMQSLEEFWSYCKVNYKKLLRGRPTNAGSMECIYLIRTAMSKDYSDENVCRRALLLAAKEFAGAGTRVPMAEEFISEAITKLELEKKPTEKDVEEALRCLVTDDAEKTKHQFQEYKILLSAVEQGTASAETINALCSEVLKPNRNAVSYFRSYLTYKQDITCEEITVQMTRFIAKLFINIFQNNVPASELSNIIVRVIRTWTDALVDGTDSWRDFVFAFTEAYGAYIKTEETNAECVKAAYDYLYFVLYKSDGEMYELSKKALQREEVRICRNPNAMLDNGKLRMVEFADSFLDSCDMIVDTSKNAVITGYERLFRMAFNPKKEISERALAIYKEKTAEFLRDKLGVADKISTTILKCQENALRDKPPIWDFDYTEKSLIWVEHLNLTVFTSYYPSEDRLSYLLEHFKGETEAIYPLLARYVEKMPFDARQSTYRVLQKSNILTRFYVYVFLNIEQESIIREVESLTGLSHFEMLSSIFSFGSASLENTPAAQKFDKWYRNELNRELVSVTAENAQAMFIKQYKFILEELKVYNSFTSEPSQLIVDANKLFFEYVYNVFDNIPNEIIGKMQIEYIDSILLIQSKSTYGKELSNQDIFTFVKDLDKAICSGITRDLCVICEVHVGDEQIIGIVKDRISMHIKANTCSSKLACQLYFVMMENKSKDSFPLDRFLNRMNYDAMSHLEKGFLLVDIVTQLHNDRAAIEKDVGKKAMLYLEQIASENPTALLDSKFILRWKQMKGLEYTKNSNFVRLMNKAARNSSVKFDLKMLGLCFAGLVTTSSLMSFFTWAVFSLTSFSTAIGIIVSLIIFISIGLVDTFMLVNLLRSKNGRKH